MDVVFAPNNIWPGVLRSDNAADFAGYAVKYVSRRLEIRHVAGASWHPQSQGAAGRKSRVIIHRRRNSPALVVALRACWLEPTPVVTALCRLLSETKGGGA